MEVSLQQQHPRQRSARVALLVAMVLAVSVAHWWTPRGAHHLHAAHVVFRKLYVLPLVLAALWFSLRSALLTVGAVSILYTPHILLQWQGQISENFNQFGELATLWIVAVVTGLLSDRQKAEHRGAIASHEGVLQALIVALNAREHGTALHSLRVRDYCLRLAQELGLSPMDRCVLAQAALLHDIGKIAVPDSILLKPGRLTTEEWRTVMRHPQAGSDILQSVPFLREAAETVHAHHESFDGTGYPRGIDGDAIPLTARVFAVADAYDALTSARPYRGPMSYEKARAEIEAHSGDQFDPQVVTAFLNIPCRDWQEIATAVEAHGI